MTTQQITLARPVRRVQLFRRLMQGALVAGAVMMMAGTARAQDSTSSGANQQAPSAQAPAVQPGTRPLRVAVVDVDQITRRSQSIQAAIKQMEGQVRVQDDKVSAKMKELSDLRQSLRDRRSVLKPDDLAAQEDRIRNLNEEIEDLQYDINKRLDKMQSEVMKPEVERIMKTVNAVAQRDGYDLVIRAEAVLYRSDMADLTPVIIQALDRQPAAPAATSAAPVDSRSSALPGDDSVSRDDKGGSRQDDNSSSQSDDDSGKSRRKKR